jgi:predicted nucleotidyltransferase component of viral defense system
MSTLREQFLERLIREVFLRKGSGFVLKGGAAMRSLLGEQRLTKDVDLDFTNPKRTADALHKTLRRAIAAAAKGLPLDELTVSAPGKRELSPRWKVNFRDRQGTRFHVEVEVSRDARRAPPGGVVQQRFAPIAAGIMSPFWVDIYDQPTLIATKVAALLGRGAARDVYDLDLLLPGAVPSAEQVTWAVERADLQEQDPVEVLGARLDALTWQRFQTDLLDALPEHIAERIDEAEWSAMRDRVGEGVQRLLQAVGVRRS